MKFRVQALAHWAAQLTNRVQLHFDGLNLGDLYSAEAAEELSSIRLQLTNIRRTEGMQAVRDELLIRGESAAAAQLNGWRAVTYESFAMSDWFCDGGFALV